MRKREREREKESENEREKEKKKKSIDGWMICNLSRRVFNFVDEFVTPAGRITERCNTILQQV